MAIEEDLAQIERATRELQIEWEKFFSGLEKRPPTDAKTKLERLIRNYAGIEIRNATQRFRYQTLTARYSTFNELWSKRLRQLEEGRVAGGPRRPAPVAASASPFDDAPPPSAGGDDASPLEDLLSELQAPAAPRPRPKPQVEHRLQNPARDQAQVRSLYEQFLEARRATGESANVKFDSFQKLIEQQASRILATKGTQAVDFRLETKDGKVSLKAKPVK